MRLSEFSRRHALEEFVAVGNADQAVGPTPTSWEGPSVPLGHEGFVLILPHDDPAAREVLPHPNAAPRAVSNSRGTLPLVALEDRQWMFFERANGLSEIVEGHLASSGLRLPPRVAPNQSVHDRGHPYDRRHGTNPDTGERRAGELRRNSFEGFARQFIGLIREYNTMLEMPEARSDVRGPIASALERRQ